MKPLDIQTFYDKKYNILVIALFTLTIVFFLAGLIIPGTIISKFNKLISREPGTLLLPIYIGIIILSFAGISFLIAEILKNPTKESVWLENVMSGLGIALIIIGIFGFFMAASKNSSIDELRELGIKGGVVLLVIHLKLGLICIGLSAIHNKFNSYGIVNNNDSQNSAIESYCPSCGKQLTIDPTDKICYHCGNDL